LHEPRVEFRDVYQKKAGYDQGGDAPRPKNGPKAILVGKGFLGTPLVTLDEHKESDPEKEKIGRTENRVAVQSEEGEEQKETNGHGPDGHAIQGGKIESVHNRVFS